MQFLRDFAEMLRMIFFHTHVPNLSPIDEFSILEEQQIWQKLSTLPKRFFQSRVEFGEALVGWSQQWIGCRVTRSHTGTREIPFSITDGRPSYPRMGAKCSEWQVKGPPRVSRWLRHCPAEGGYPRYCSSYQKSQRFCLRSQPSLFVSLLVWFGLWLPLCWKLEVYYCFWSSEIATPIPLNLKHRRRQRRNEADGNVVRTVLLGTDRSAATKTNAYGKVPRLSKIVYLSDYSLLGCSWVLLANMVSVGRLSFLGFIHVWQWQLARYVPGLQTINPKELIKHC